MPEGTRDKIYCHKCPCVIVRAKELSTEHCASVPQAVSSGDFYVIEDKFQFDNIGVTRPHQDQVYIICADDIVRHSVGIRARRQILSGNRVVAQRIMIDLQPPSVEFFGSLQIVPYNQDSKMTVALHSDPTLRHRFQMLGAAGSDWLRYLSWSTSEQGQALEYAILRAQTFRSDPESLRYAHIDLETYLAIFRVDLLDSGVSSSWTLPLWVSLVLYVHVDGEELDWRLYELNLASPESRKLPCSKTFDMSYIQEQSAITGEADNETLDQEDYWDAYDKDTPGEETERLSLGLPEQSYYDRYTDEVATAIGEEGDLPESRVALPTITGSAHRAKEISASAMKSKIALHTEQSIRSLRALCSAAGIDEDEFRTIVQRGFDGQ